MSKWAKSVAVAALVISVGACSATYRNHGFVPFDEDLASIIVGVDTRVSVEDVLGLPTIGGVSNDDGLYYVGSRWRHFGPSRPRPISREIVAVTFDDNDVVTNITRYGLEDGQVVALSRRVTEGGANEISFIRQLMGSAGRIDPGSLIGADR